MNEIKPDTDQPISTSEQPSEVQSSIAELQRQITYLTLALLIASGTFCVYMWRQARIARADLTTFKVAAVQMLQSYQQEKPRWDAFVAKVGEYGKTHPDFAPIIEKYKISVTQPPTGAVAPKPAQAEPAPAKPATAPAK